MTENCKANEITIENLERRVEKLERQQEKDVHEITENNKQLSIIVVELKTITKTMESLAENWKEAILHSEEKHDLEKIELTNRIKKLENNMEKLNDKIDNRTIGKASEMWDKSKWIIISAIISAVATMICANIIK